MKTVQDYLRKLDRTELLDTYFSYYPIDWNDQELDDMKLGDIKDYFRGLMNDFISRLIGMKPEKAEYGDCVLYVIYHINNSIPEELFIMNHVKDLLSDPEKAESYAYEFRPHAEIIGYYVADNPVTQHNIYRLIADVLSEMTFFGYGEDYKEEKFGELLEAKDDVESGIARTVSVEEYYREQNITFPWNNPEAEELRRKIYDAESDYLRFWEMKEKKEIIETIKKVI